MRVFQVSMPSLYQMAVENQSSEISRLIPLFAQTLGHCRLLTFVLPATTESLERTRQKLAMARPETWERRGLMSEVEMIREYGRDGSLRLTRHFLMDFEDIINERDLLNYGLTAKLALPKSPLIGEYAEATDHLYPVLNGGNSLRTDNSRYHATIMASVQLNRTWDWRYPLATLVAEADGPMIIAVDMRKVSATRVEASSQFWEGMVLNAQDRDAAARRQEAEMALDVRGESVHHVQVLLMLLDKSLSNLRERMDALSKKTVTFMKMDGLKGYQANALKMFGPQPKPGGLPDSHFNTLSRLPAVACGLLGYADEQKHNGFYVGVSQGTTARQFLYLDWKGGQGGAGYDAIHGMILGRTGKGKTVLAQAMATRFAEQGIQTVFFEPMGHCKRIMQVLGSEVCSYNRLTYENARINILDVMYERPEEQFDYVRSLLRFLLTTGSQMREFTVDETIAINRALTLTYEGFDWEKELLDDPKMTPTLRVFCTKLRLIADLGGISEAAILAALTLAEQLEGLYLTGQENTFNTYTNLDVRLNSRVSLFDFSAVPEARVPFFYQVALNNLKRRIMRGDRTKRGVLFVDEVFRMSRTPGLMAFLADLIKTVRSRGWAVILIDQDLEAYIGKPGAESMSAALGLDIVSGQLILNNISWLISFGLGQQAADQLGEFYEDILPHQVQFLKDMGPNDPNGRDKGMAIYRADGITHIMHCLLRGTEYALLGS